MTDNNRILSIDIMRGLTLLLMIFLNDLYMPEIPEWTDYKASGSDVNGLADWVFPGFLFIAGMAIPCSIDRRISNGEDNFTIAKHIVVRSVSLLIIGLLMLNSERVNQEFTGIGKNLWTILMFTGVFMIWNKYQETESNFFTIQGLRLLGMGVLVALVFKFRSGEFENNGSLITGSWGALGIIGWGYLSIAYIYLAARGSMLNIVIAYFFFLAMNILSVLDLLTYLDPAKPIFGVIIDGYVPMIVISGTLTIMILKKYSTPGKAIVTIVTIGAVNTIAGLILHILLYVNDLTTTPGRGLIYNGISTILFSLLFWFIDVKKKPGCTSLIQTAGENSLTTCLATGILYYTIWSTGIPLLFYKLSGNPLVLAAGSVIWTLLMVGLTSLLVRCNIKLKI